MNQQNRFFTNGFMDFIKKRDVLRQLLRNGYYLTANPLDTFRSSRRQYTRESLYNDIFVKGNQNNFILANTCNTQVNDDYIKDVFYDAISNRNKYEILLLQRSQDNLNVGFAIIQFGECQQNEFINTPALQLICATDGGRYLLYTYLSALLYHYTRTNNNAFQYGLLELANAYSNIGSLCAYNKFGFREDYNLIYENCFGTPGTLPMIVNLHNVSQDDLDNVIVKNIKIHANDNEEPLCNDYYKNNRKQQSIRIRERQRNYNRLSKINHTGEIKYIDELLNPNHPSRQQIIRHLNNAKQNNNIVMPGGYKYKKKKTKKKKQKKKKKTYKR